MGFKSMVEYNDERYGGMFLLRNDGDFAEVIFMYPSKDAAMIVDAHYIKSDRYSGYTQCLGVRVCPACEQNIRVQTKLFIPVYVIDSDEILFWDRNTRFFQQLETDVFSKFEDPTEFVFRITRHGASGDINTRYEIVAVAKNNIISYEEILQKHGISFPEYYETICVDWSVEDYRSHLVAPSKSVDVEEMPEYKITPRVESAIPEFSESAEGEDDVELADDVNF